MQSLLVSHITLKLLLELVLESLLIKKTTVVPRTLSLALERLMTLTDSQTVQGTMASTVRTTVT